MNSDKFMKNMHYYIPNLSQLFITIMLWRQKLSQKMYDVGIIDRTPSSLASVFGASVNVNSLTNAFFFIPA